MQGTGEGAKPKLVLCAGQGCEQRKTCMRWRIRVASATWESRDIERRHFEGPCPVYVQIEFNRTRR